MPEQKLYVVQGFKPEGRGLLPQAQHQCDNETEARNLSARLFKSYPGVVAWEVEVEAGTGQLREAAVLLKIGRVPDQPELAPQHARPGRDIADQLLEAADRLEEMPRAEVQALLRRAAAAIGELRRSGAGVS